MSATNTKTLITVKVDKILKIAGQVATKEIGIPLGTLINCFLKQFVRTGEENFSIPYKTIKRLKRGILKGKSK